MPSQPEVNAYLKTLEPEIAAFYMAADTYCQGTEDTLSEDFQLAASIVEAFHKRIEAKADLGQVEMFKKLKGKK